MIERAATGLEIKVHPHMLRHACGFKLANDGVDTRALQAYLGHRSIQHTVRYTELAPDRFKGFWKDEGAFPPYTGKRARGYYGCIGLTSITGFSIARS